MNDKQLKKFYIVCALSTAIICLTAYVLSIN